MKAIRGRVFKRAVYPRRHPWSKQIEDLLSLGGFVFAEEEVIDGKYLYFDFVLVMNAELVKVRMTRLVAVENKQIFLLVKVVDEKVREHKFSLLVSMNTLSLLIRQRVQRKLLDQA